MTIQKVDPGQTWDLLVEGDYDMSISYWTNDIIDPDQKSTFSLGMDGNKNFQTRYQNEHAAELVAEGRVELDPDKRRDIYYELQAIAKEDVPWIDLYYSPYRNISRTNVHDFVQNPLGKFLLETTSVDE
jgi:peptide/nickel transport system substrate-binding protein